MKILKTTIFTLFLGVLSITAQTSGSKNTIAKNSPEMAEKKTQAPAAPAEEEKSEAAPITVRSLLSRAGVDNVQTSSLSLNDAIRKALENNNEIEVAKQDVKIAESNLRSFLGFYDPVFTISPSYVDDVQPTASTVSGGGNSGSIGSKQFTVNADATQFIKQGGGSYSLFFNNNRRQTSATISQFTPTFTNTLGVNYTQPLMRNFSIDANRRNIRIQRKRISQSDADFRARTIDIIRLVQTSYWDLVFALRDQQNRVENLDLSKENLRQVRAKIKAGSSAPLAEAEVLTELANREADVIIAAQLVANAENALKQLIIRDPNSPEWSAQVVPSDRPVLGEDQVDLDAVVRDAIANRPELNRLRIDREINDIDIQYFRNQVKPRIDLNWGYSLAGLAGTPTAIAAPGTFNPIFVGGFDEALKNLFSTDFSTVSVGVTISFPLRNRTAKADLATAETQRTRLEATTRSSEQSVIVEVRNAVQALEAARQRIVAAREALKNAQIQLDGQRTLFQLGRSDTFLLFQRENQLAAARNALIRAETDYNKALADLQRATSTTLTVNNVQIDTPVRDK